MRITNPNGTVKCRLSNECEIVVYTKLEDEGWTVLKNGWPDFIAFKKVENGFDVRLLEVKKNGRSDLSHRQKRMAEVLKPFFKYYLVKVGQHGKIHLKQI